VAIDLVPTEPNQFRRARYFEPVTMALTFERTSRDGRYPIEITVSPTHQRDPWFREARGGPPLTMVQFDRYSKPATAAVEVYHLVQG
jgi:hypothetical protein